MCRQKISTSMFGTGSSSYTSCWFNELFRNAKRSRPEAESKLSAPEDSISSRFESSSSFSALARNSNFPGVNISVEEDGECDDDFSTLRLVVFATLRPAEVGKAGLYPQQNRSPPAGAELDGFSSGWIFMCSLTVHLSP